MVNESNKKVEMKTTGKFRKEKIQAPPTKIVVRKLPPTFTEEEFKNAISPVPDNNYFSFVPADKRLGIQAYSRAYINFINSEEIVSFRDRFDGYVFVDQKGNEYPALVEYAPFQKIPKTNHNKKDIRCGTIDEDPDYLAFLELLQNPEAVNLPQIETLLEEIENAEREIRANNGVIKVKTPLLEYIEQRNAERYRPGDRKRRKEFDRKKAREEEKRRKKDYIKEYRKRDDYYAAREERERERAKRREEEKLKWKEKREEREKLRREKAAERFKNDEKFDSKDLVDENVEEIKSSQTGGKEHSQKEDKSKAFPSQKSKRYSEVRKKEEKDRKKDSVKNKGNEENKEDIPLMKDDAKIETESPSKNASEDAEKENVIEETYETKVSTKEEVVEQKESSDTKDYEQEGEENSYEQEDKIEEHGKDKYDDENDDDVEKDDKDDKMSKDKDPRTERRIRNKDRPAMQLYRPGQARLKTRLKSNEDGGTNNDGDSSSSSTSPVMGVNEEEKDKEDKKIAEPSEYTTTKPTGKSYSAARSGGYDKKYPKYRDSRGGGQHHHHHHHWDDRENYGYSKYKDDYEGSTRGSGRGRKGYSYHQERENKSKWANKSRENDSSQFKSMTFRRSTSQE